MSLSKSNLSLSLYLLLSLTFFPYWLYAYNSTSTVNTLLKQVCFDFGFETENKLWLMPVAGLVKVYVGQGWAIISPEEPHWVVDLDEQAGRVVRETNPPIKHWRLIDVLLIKKYIN